MPRRRSDARGKLLRAYRALDFCERLFAGGVVAGAIGRASTRHGLLDQLDCLQRYFPELVPVV